MKKIGQLYLMALLVVLISFATIKVIQYRNAPEVIVKNSCDVTLAVLEDFPKRARDLFGFPNELPPGSEVEFKLIFGEGEYRLVKEAIGDEPEWFVLILPEPTIGKITNIPINRAKFAPPIEVNGDSVEIPLTYFVERNEEYVLEICSS